MIHSIERVAAGHYLDQGIAAEVAQRSTNVLRERGTPYVSTAQADAFIGEVRTAQGDQEANERIRRREMARYMAIVAAGGI